MRPMNDMLRAYGKFDVARGLFSFYSELHVKSRQVNGYVKPLFRDMKVYDKRKDAEKSAFKKLYLKLIGGLSKLLENRTTRKEVATRTRIQGELGGGTKIGTWEAIANIVRNAFFRAILPGFDAELGGGGKGEKQERSSSAAPVPAVPAAPVDRAAAAPAVAEEAAGAADPGAGAVLSSRR